MKQFDPSKPYNDLPALPPKKDVESKVVLKKTTNASRALAELKGIGGIIPNQTILIDSLILQEAKASSEIENVITTNDSLYKAFCSSSQQFDPNTKEVIRYRHAVWEAFNQLQSKQTLFTSLFVKIVQTIKENKSGIRNTPGTTIFNFNTGDVIYTPPEGESLLQDKLHDLERFIHDDNSLDPLIQMALIHYQFESIHPFSDGNGRTGRILNILFLVLKGLLDLPVLFISRYIIDNKGEYYRLLREVTENDNWEAWILYMLDAVETTALDTKNRILDIYSLMQKTIDIAKDQLPKRVYSKELIELIFQQPYTKGQFLVNAEIVKRQTAAEYLKELERIGILKSHKIGLETLYLNVELYKLLSK